MTAKINELCEKIKAFLTENGLTEIELPAMDYWPSWSDRLEGEELYILEHFDNQSIYTINSWDDYTSRYIRAIYIEDNKLLFDVDDVLYYNDEDTSLTYREKITLENVIELSENNNELENALNYILSITLSGNMAQMLIKYSK